MIRVSNADSNVSILICALILKILKNNTIGTKKSFTDLNFVRFTANNCKFCKILFKFLSYFREVNLAIYTSIREIDFRESL